MRRGYISPSLMCLDPMNVERGIRKLEKEEVDFFHVDVMDNHFVPNITLSTDFIKAIKKITRVPLDIHLMIEEPEKHTISQLSCCGAEDLVSIHYESTRHPQKVLKEIHDMGCRAGLAINPASPVCGIEHLLYDADLILVMTVNPGFAGQTLLPGMTKKVSKVREMLDGSGFSDTWIEVDGNVSFENAGKLRMAGADIFVAGTSSLFSPSGTLHENVQKFRNILS